MGERIGRVGLRESLTSKAKAGCTNKAEQLLPTSGQVFSHLQGSWRWTSLYCLRRQNTITLNIHPSSFFLQLLLSCCDANMIWYGMEYPFGHFGSALPAGSPPSCLYAPSLLTDGVVWEAGKVSTLCKHCSEIAKISLNYQHWFQHKSKTWSHTSCYEEI